MASMEREDWEMFLENNYHQLSRRIRVENLFSRLRSMSVLSLDDQEMILNQYRTPFLKAGHLVDIVKTKGRTGFDKFMEAIEYEYPEVYKETTGREPRPNPDKESKRRPGVTSTLVLDKMGDLIHTFTDQLSKKQLELRQFEELVQQLRADLEKQTEDQKNLEDQIRHLEDSIQELRDEKKEMVESLSKERRLREEFEEKYDRLRSRNLDEMYNLSRQPFRQCVSLNPSAAKVPASSQPSSSSSSSLSPPVVNRHSKPSPGKVQMLKNAYEHGTPKPCQPEAEVVAEVDKKTGSEIERPSADVTGLEENCCRLQESNDRLQCCIEEFKKEADECRSKQLEAESLSREANAENEKLKTEMRKMEDQCKVMADMIRRLKNEIDSRPPKPKKLLIPRMFPGSGSGGDGEDSQSGSETSSPDKAGGRVQPKSKPDDQQQQRTGSESAPPPVTNTLLQSSFGLFVNPWTSVDSSN